MNLKWAMMTVLVATMGLGAEKKGGPEYILKEGTIHRFHLLSDHRRIDSSGGTAELVETWVKVTIDKARADGAVPITIVPERVKFIWRVSGNAVDEGYDVPIAPMADGSGGNLLYYDSTESKKGNPSVMGKEFEVFLGEYLRRHPLTAWIQPNGHVVETRPLEPLKSSQEVLNQLVKMALPKELKDVLKAKFDRDESLVTSLNELLNLVEGLPRVLAGQLFPELPSGEGKQASNLSVVIGGIGYFVGGGDVSFQMTWKKTPTGWKGTGSSEAGALGEVVWEAATGALKSSKVESYRETLQQNDDGEFTNVEKHRSVVERLPPEKK